MCFSSAPKMPKPVTPIIEERAKTPDVSNSNYTTSSDERKRLLKSHGIASTQLTGLLGEGTVVSSNAKKKLGE